MQCGEKCTCRNCDNGGKRRESNGSATGVGQKRKRTNPCQYKKVRSADYLASLNVPLNQKLWTVFEQCLLVTIASFLSSTLVSPSLNNVSELYNNVASSKACHEPKLPIRPKTSQKNCKTKAVRGKKTIALSKIIVACM